MLRSEQELRATHESIVRLYALRDSLLVEKTGDPELRPASQGSTSTATTGPAPRPMAGRSSLSPL